MVPACGDIVSTIDDLLCEATTQCHTHSILQELLGVEAFQECNRTLTATCSPILHLSSSDPQMA